MKDKENKPRPESEFSFITGRAGTGKTTLTQQRHKENSRWAILAATTGQAAVNLASDDMDVKTINSVLGYFDTDNMRDSLCNGRLLDRLKDLWKGGSSNLLIDECSMLDAMQLDYLITAVKELNEIKYVQQSGGFGVILVGDFCQLPPVKAEYAFKAVCWEEVFGSRVTKLDKIWRQDNAQFMEAINYARGGDGQRCAEALNDLGCFVRSISSDFDGTTILPTNSECRTYNNGKYTELLAHGNKKITVDNYRWGKQRSEWKQIPSQLEVCENAYVQIRANDCPAFTYVNGDTGHVQTMVQSNLAGNTGNGNDTSSNRVCLDVVLCRDGKSVSVPRVTRRVMQKMEYAPEGLELPDLSRYPSTLKEFIEQLESETLNVEDLDDLRFLHSGRLSESKKYRAYLMDLTYEHRLRQQEWNSPYFDYYESKWCIGEITYSPITLAYATTVHKSQGLSLDSVQVDCSHYYFGMPSMMYVALSRCRTPEGLKIAGGPKLLAQKTNILVDVLPWV